jgi:predicted nucleic acid-binding protein
MILLDAGPMIAFIDRSDSQHQRCLETLRQLANQSMLTTWPCFTEAMFLLRRNGGHPLQQALWQLCFDGSVALHTPTLEESVYAAALMDRYQDLPMDLGDATLMATAHAPGITQIFTLDSDFHIYKLDNGSTLQIFP